MILIVSGSRTIVNPYCFLQGIALMGYPPIQYLFVGDARGVDAMACDFAERNAIERFVYHANWDRFGKRAGIVRNHEMIDAAIAFGERCNLPVKFLALWDGSSPGTRDAIHYAHDHQLDVSVLLVERQ